MTKQSCCSTPWLLRANRPIFLLQTDRLGLEVSSPGTVILYSINLSRDQ